MMKNLNFHGGLVFSLILNALSQSVDGKHLALVFLSVGRLCMA